MRYDIETPYTASYVVLRRDNKVAFILRSHTTWMNGYYSLPAGKVEKGENFLQAAVREAKEEAGIEIEFGDIRHKTTMHRLEISESNYADNVWVDLFFEAEKWTGEPFNAEPHKHSELAWLDPAHLPENVVPNVRVAMAAIIAGKPYCEYGWDA